MSGDLSIKVAITDSAGDLSNLSQATVKVVPAPAAHIVVNSTKDQLDPINGNIVSFDDAIARANAAYGPITITFDPAIFASAQQLSLNALNDAGVLELSNPASPVDIIGPAAGFSVVSPLVVDAKVIAVLSGISINGGGARRH